MSRVRNAAFVGDEEEMMMLLVLGADVQEALNGAAFGGHLDFVKFLCSHHGADPLKPSQTCPLKSTPAHLAASWDRVEVLQYLRECGENFQTPDTRGGLVHSQRLFSRSGQFP